MKTPPRRPWGGQGFSAEVVSYGRFLLTLADLADRRYQWRWTTRARNAPGWPAHIWLGSQSESAGEGIVAQEEGCRLLEDLPGLLIPAAGSGPGILHRRHAIAHGIVDHVPTDREAGLLAVDFLDVIPGLDRVISQASR